MKLLLTIIVTFFAGMGAGLGTSVFIMAFTTFTGATSHFMIGGAPDWIVFILCVVFTLL